MNHSGGHASSQNIDPLRKKAEKKKKVYTQK